MPTAATVAPKHRNYVTNQVLDPTVMNALFGLLGEFASPNFALQIVSNTIRLNADASTSVALTIQGAMRFVNATLTASPPAAPAGVGTIYATSHVNSDAAEDAGSFDYSFGLKLSAPSGTGEEAISRIVGQYLWDGSSIVGIIPAFPIARPDAVPIGGLLPYAGLTDPANTNFMLADGRLKDRTMLAALFTLSGHAFNGGVDPGSNMMRLPDLRGRVFVGADNMGTAQGAAGRTTANNTRGAVGGEETHHLAGAEVGPHTHSGSTGTEDHSLDHTHATYATPVRTNPADTFSSLVVTAGGAGGHVPSIFPGNYAEAFGTLSVNTGLTPHFHGITTNTGDGVTGAAHQNMQPFQVCNAIVRIA